MLIPDVRTKPGARRILAVVRYGIEGRGRIQTVKFDRDTLSLESTR